jgi:non-specific serine/threonine protein kinase/serine/threonine-protein kinase
MVTPESASPEQLKGETITTATDVYGLGVLLYRLITGTAPYRLQLGTDAELVQAICEQTPIPPSQVARRIGGNATTAVLDRTISPEIDHVIGKALRKEPERRYTTAEELGEDLRRFLMRLPVTAMPDSWSYRARKTIARNRVAAVAVTAILIVLAAGIVATAWQASVAARERNRAQHQFEAVRTLASSVLWELREVVAKLPGSGPAQELLMKRATEYLDRLAAEAGDDLNLRRELANGYEQLGQVRGASGLPNLGDVDAAKVAYLKSNALLESIPPPLAVDADRHRLASNYLRLASMQRESADRGELLGKARALVEHPRESSDVPWHAVEQLLWDEIANDQIAQKNYPEARISVTNALRAAEGAYNLTSDGIDRSRNLSLACKRLGAVLQVLNQADEAMAQYNRALALDLARLEREPENGLWRLDLSFSYASIGLLQAQQGDAKSGLASYEKALELRRAVVAANPDDDFARGSLARGYERIAGLMSEIGDVGGAIDARMRGVDVYRQRVTAHPERENLRKDYEEAAIAAIRASLDLAEASTTSRQVRNAVTPRIRTVLAGLVGTLQQQAEKPPGPRIIPAEVKALEQRLNALAAP